MSVLGQYNSCYTKEHWQDASRVLRYLRGNANYSLVYKNGIFNLTGYADDNYADDEDDRRSSLVSSTY